MRTPSLVLPRLALDRRGATIIEFALILPVMLMVIMGLGDLTYQGYVQAVLTGAVQKAGRDSTIQNAGSQTTQIDAKVMQQVNQVANGATFDSTRSSYVSFTGVGKPEPFVDTAGTGVYDPTKDCFTDLNGNNSWDANGVSGQGGANDVTVYMIHIYYQRLFPVAALIGMSQTVKLSGMTVLKNQPWSSQSQKQICPK